MAEESELPLERLQDDIKEQMENEGGEEGATPKGRGRSHYLNILAASTAVFAVLAAIASLLSGNYANEALFQANQSVLRQNRASDTWAEYQADGIKRISYTNAAASLKQAGAPDQQVQDASANAKREGDKQPPLQRSAQGLQDNARELEQESLTQLEHHHQYAFSVTFFQVAIGLAALAALIGIRPRWWINLTGRGRSTNLLLGALDELGPLWLLSLISGLAGIIFLILGARPIHAVASKPESPQTGATPAALCTAPAMSWQRDAQQGACCALLVSGIAVPATAPAGSARS